MIASMSNRLFVPGAKAPDAPARRNWFIFDGSRLLVQEGADGVMLPFEDVETPDFALLRTQYVGLLGDVACFSAETHPDQTPPDGMKFKSLRGLFKRMDPELFWVAGRAVQIVDWDRTHQFCGRCGAETQSKLTEHVKACPECKLHAYPRQSPAVIMAVEWGDKLLLARNVNWPEGRYSVLAGFVEPGESLEQTVAREVREEVGIEVDNIRYFGSQPWPFPNSLMLGFTAQYAGGELTPDNDEIAEAGWFLADELPYVPPPPSIASALIRDFLARHGDPEGKLATNW